MNGLIGHATSAFRNAFLSPGFKLFGLRFSRDYPRIVDCGANIGMSVLFFKALRPDAQVIAFEPDPVTCAHLLRTVETNGLRSVQIENAAVGGHEGTVTFYTSVADPASLSASIEPAWGGEATRTVRMVRLSSLLVDQVDLLKLDVEGAEYAVIDDLMSTGTIRLIREAVIEYHDVPSRPDGAAHLTRLLQTAGFEVALVNAERRNGVLHARRRSIGIDDQTATV